MNPKKTKHYSGKKKTNYEQSLGIPIKNYVHQFIYRDEECIVLIDHKAGIYKIELSDNEEYKKLSKKIAKAERDYIEKKIDTISISFSTRNTPLDQGLENLIQKWLVNTELRLPKNWRNWIIPILPLFRFYKISPITRSDLFDKYRQSQLVKLNDAINTLIKIQKLNAEFVMDAGIDARVNGLISDYTNEVHQLDKEKSGHNKFLYPLIEKLFIRLESYPINKQVKFVYDLYCLGNFDDYGKINDVDSGIKKINKIRDTISKNTKKARYM